MTARHCPECIRGPIAAPAPDLGRFRTLLRDTAERGERAVRGEPVSQMSKRATSAPPTLSDIGLTRDESSRYQQLAAMPATKART